MQHIHAGNQLLRTKQVAGAVNRASLYATAHKIRTTLVHRYTWLARTCSSNIKIIHTHNVV